jgi:hypothetical protein
VLLAFALHQPQRYTKDVMETLHVLARSRT